MIRNIVVVDDELEYLGLISEFAAFSSLHTVTFSEWSDEVFAHLKDDSLLLLDINMPNKDGIDSLVVLSESGYLGGIVLLSGAEESVLTSVQKLGESLKLNMFGNLAKPFTLQEFENTIARFNISQRPSDSYHIASDSLMFNLDKIKHYLAQSWIYPVYQPQINPSNMRVEGFECLSRLKHPESGFIAPQVFIDHFTQQGLIADYTLLLIDKALSESANLLHANTDLVISFNVSALSLNQVFTVDFLDIVASHNVNSKQVTLEITETSAICLSEEALYAVSKFRTQGFNLSVDDFGTGYSTFLQLNDLPFTELKVDKAFIDKMAENDKSYKIVKASFMLAEIMELKSVAEGVETVNQLNLIKKMNCDLVQGYIYSRPLLFPEFSEFYSSFND